MAKILLLIAHDGFQQHEYSVPKRILLEADHTVVTGSDMSGIATGADGVTTVPVDVLLYDIDMHDYDAVFAIGGPGALDYLDNQETNRIFNEAMLMQKFYGAICISPRILAKAHVLTGKKATGWNDDGVLPEIFAQNNVTYVPELVVVDGNVITAEGPMAAEAFGEAIMKKFG